MDNIPSMQLSDIPLPILITVSLFTVWSLWWKGLALWHAAQRRDKVWFIVLLLFNSVGILEMVYLFGVARIMPKRLFVSSV